MQYDDPCAPETATGEVALREVGSTPASDTRVADTATGEAGRRALERRRTDAASTRLHRPASSSCDERHVNKNKVKTVFCSIDAQSNRRMDADEFAKFFQHIGVTLARAELDLIFQPLEAADVAATSRVAARRDGETRANDGGSAAIRDVGSYAMSRRRHYITGRLLTDFDTIDEQKAGDVPRSNYVLARQRRLVDDDDNDEEMDDDDDGKSPETRSEPRGRVADFYEQMEAQAVDGCRRERWTASRRRHDGRREGTRGDDVPGDVSLLHLPGDDVPGDVSLLHLPGDDDVVPSDDSLLHLPGDGDVVPGDDSLLHLPGDDDVVPGDDSLLHLPGDDVPGDVSLLHLPGDDVVPSDDSLLHLPGDDDVVPSDVSLLHLACFANLPPIVPRHCAVSGVVWAAGGGGGTSGRAVFPAHFSGRVPTDIATNSHLAYYGCSMATGNPLSVSLLHRHGIQDFTYDDGYLSDYVTHSDFLAGAGLERHHFAHLDCPFDDHSGHFVIGKMVDTDGGTELHLTAFKVPTLHTIYVPPDTIHSNDYLKGTWRTMLSDEAAIDHVQLVRQRRRAAHSDRYEHFTFSID